MSELTVAVIGTGRMGAAMVAKLRAAGAEVVVFNRTADKAHRLAAETGARVAATAAEAAGLLAQSGARLLDAPVSGSVASVQQGTLVVLAGGDAADLEVARPVFDVFARQVFHVGLSGSGAVMKLAVNTLVHALNQALSESLVLAEKAGIDRSTAYDVISASAA